MATVIEKKAGQWSKSKARDIRRFILSILFLFMLSIGFVIGFFVGRYQRSVAAVLFMFTSVIILFIWRRLEKIMDRFDREKVKYLRGGQAEALIAWYLNDLPDAFHVFHNVPLPTGGDIDHIVVGPPGVFVVSTKSYKGHVTRSVQNTILLNGKPLTDLAGAQQQALWLATRLKSTLGNQVPWVQPVLALPHAYLDVKTDDAQVWIINDDTVYAALDPDKPKRKIAGSRAAQIAAEVEKALSNND